MADPLPMTLRVYRKLSSAMVPLAPALIKPAAQARQGRSGARRRAPRRQRRCPPARAAGLDSRRQRRRGAGRRRPGREIAGAEPAHPADLGHGDVGGDRRQTISARRHPSICALRLAALCGALPRPLAAVAGAVHRMRPVAEPDPVERGAAAADGVDQRADVAALVPALAPGLQHHLGAARPLRRLPRAVADSMPTGFQRSAAATS